MALLSAKFLLKAVYCVEPLSVKDQIKIPYAAGTEVSGRSPPGGE